MIGINQLLLLRRCYLKGKIGFQDVGIYYSIMICEKNKDKLLAVFERLEVKGLLFQVDNYNWELTDFGKSVIKDRFDLKKEAS